MNDKLHLTSLPEEQKTLLELLSNLSFIRDFYLAGGTGLALQIGHRRSIDFDFFIPADFDTSVIINQLMQVGRYERENEEKNTINGILNHVRISFFGYKYKIIDDFKTFNNVKLAGLKDIAAMKLEAIAGRGSKKDFIDLCFLLKEFKLVDIFRFHAEKYGTGLSNQYHHLKSLAYFSDAESEPMPEMIILLKWEDARKKIISVVKEYKL